MNGISLGDLAAAATCATSAAAKPARRSKAVAAAAPPSEESTPKFRSPKVEARRAAIVLLAGQPPDVVPGTVNLNEPGPADTVAETAVKETADLQVMPDLSAEEERELEESILTHGVLEPIKVDEHGTIIDGHHRQKIAKRHNLPCPHVVMSGFTDAEKRTLALTLNLDRRHLSREQRREVLAKSIKADPQLSDRAHAQRTGSSDKTAGAVRRDLEANAEIPHSSDRVTANGKPAPGPKPKPKPRSSKAEAPVEDAPAQQDAHVEADAQPPAVPAESTTTELEADKEPLPDWQPGLDGDLYPPAKTNRQSPRPSNEFVAGFGFAVQKLEQGMLGLQKKVQLEEMVANREEVIRTYRDTIEWVVDTGKVLLTQYMSDANPTA